MKAKGASAEITKRIENGLNQRIQVVKVGREMPEEGDIGSKFHKTVLGPSLFTVFMDDMDDVDDCIMALANIIKFADAKC